MRASSTPMIGSWRPCAMNARRTLTVGQARAPALEHGDEPGEGEYPGGRGPVGAEPERVAHHGAHREAAEHGLRGTQAGALPQLVVQRRQLAVGRVERLGVGIADTRHEVPVKAGRALQAQRSARRDDVQAPVGVERVGERKQVGLVGAAAVMEHEQAGGLAGSGPLAIGQRAHCRCIIAEPACNTPLYQ